MKKAILLALIIAYVGTGCVSARHPKNGCATWIATKSKRYYY